MIFKVTLKVISIMTLLGKSTIVSMQFIVYRFRVIRFFTIWKLRAIE